MEIHSLNRIKEALPGNYAVLIAEKLQKLNISAAQVTRVFRGETTNPDRVKVVVDAALEIINVNKAMEAKIVETLNPQE